MNLDKTPLAGALLATLTTGALLTGTAVAGDYWNNYDRMTISGAQCQPSDGQYWPEFWVNPEGIRNIGTATRYVSCALVLDAESNIAQADMDNATSAGRYEIAVTLDYRFLAGSATVNTPCTVIRIASDGTRTAGAFTVSGTAGDPTVLTSVVPAVLEGMSIGSSASSVSINCRLAPKVRLLTLKTYQYGSTNHYRYQP